MSSDKTNILKQTVQKCNDRPVVDDRCSRIRI